MANKIRIGLDWTPNTIHSGLYIALSKSFYDEEGLFVELISPNEEYSSTPAKLLQAGKVDLAICPSESVIAYNETNALKLQAIYALLQKDASAIVSTTCKEAKDLSEARYGSYNAKYEDDIVRILIAHAGGDGSSLRVERATGKLSLFDQVKQKQLDATWVFLPWEGVEAQLDGTTLYEFTLGDYGIPYGYSPVIARNKEGSLDAETTRKFIKATIKGYQFAIENPEEAAKLIKEHTRPQRSIDFLKASQEKINAYYRDGSQTLGYMQPEKWDQWIEWLTSRDLLKKQLNQDDLFTNEFFPLENQP